MSAVVDDGEPKARYSERVSMVLAAGRVGIWGWSSGTHTLTWDDRTASIWGVSLHQRPDVNAFLAAVHADDREMLRRNFDALFSSEIETGASIEFRIRRFDDGRERWVSARGRVFRQDGVDEMIGTTEDITDQKMHDLHLHMLLREITHRSKNLLAIIQAMARQTVKDSLSAEDFERRLSLRLRGLAASHELLAAQDWHGAHMEELVKGQLVDVLETYTTRVSVRGEPLFLKPEAAQNIGLALNELATNATRYGALSNGDGRVEVAWSVEPSSGGEGRLHVTWSEFGGPAVSPPQRQGFGRKVVERVAASALDGSVSLTFAPEGLQWSLRIPGSFVLSGPPENSDMPKLFSA